MFCKKCGNKLSETDKFCSNCGYRLGEDPVMSKPEIAPDTVAQPDAVVETPAVTFNPAVAPQAAPEAPKKFAGKAIAGFVVSLAGLFSFPITCGIVALILSLVSFGQTGKGEFKGKGFSIAGLIISIVSIVYGIFNLITIITAVTIALELAFSQMEQEMATFLALL